jgi:signal peptidase I
VVTRPGVNATYVKRVTALPGDRVTCCNGQGQVAVNGKPLHETYISKIYPPSERAFSATLGAGQMWVMGDNREVALDSRYWGPISTSGMIGRVVGVGKGLPARTLRTPQTFVTEGLAPPDHRVAPYLAWLLVALAGLLAVIILGIVGTIRFFVRRSRSRRSGRGPHAPVPAPGAP